MTPAIALAGNPNVGKSTVFNALTGLNQHTGNWPGKTVETAHGYYEDADGRLELVDLPGCYSLLAHSEEEEVAQAISVIFFFNVLAALIFPSLGQWLGFDTTTGEAFGIFAGTAVNDTSSVTAAASTWDSLFNLGSETLDKAITVKLTRTLAIIPITLGLSFWRSRHGEETPTNLTWGQKIKASLPQFIIYFVLASLLTTICLAIGLPDSLFAPFKWASKFLIVWAMAAIGLNTDLVKLLRSGASALGLGAVCWIAITLVSLGLQYVLGFW